MKSQSQDSETSQTLSFAEILEGKEGQLLKEKVVEAPVLAVSLAAMPMLSLSIDEAIAKTQRNSDLQVEPREQVSSEIALSQPTMKQEMTLAGTEMDELQGDTMRAEVPKPSLGKNELTTFPLDAESTPRTLRKFVSSLKRDEVFTWPRIQTAPQPLLDPALIQIRAKQEAIPSTASALVDVASPLDEEERSVDESIETSNLAVERGVMIEQALLDEAHASAANQTIADVRKVTKLSEPPVGESDIPPLRPARSAVAAQSAVASVRTDNGGSGIATENSDELKPRGIGAQRPATPMSKIETAKALAEAEVGKAFTDEKLAKSVLINHGVPGEAVKTEAQKAQNQSSQINTAERQARMVILDKDPQSDVDTFVASRVASKSHGVGGVVEDNQQTIDSEDVTTVPTSKAVLDAASGQNGIEIINIADNDTWQAHYGAAPNGETPAARLFATDTRIDEQINQDFTTTGVDANLLNSQLPESGHFESDLETVKRQGNLTTERNAEPSQLSSQNLEFDAQSINPIYRGERNPVKGVVASPVRRDLPDLAQINPVMHNPQDQEADIALRVIEITAKTAPTGTEHTQSAIHETESIADPIDNQTKKGTTSTAFHAATYTTSSIQAEKGNSSDFIDVTSELVTEVTILLDRPSVDPLLVQRGMEKDAVGLGTEALSQTDMPITDAQRFSANVTAATRSVKTQTVSQKDPAVTIQYDVQKVAPVQTEIKSAGPVAETEKIEHRVGADKSTVEVPQPARDITAVFPDVITDAKIKPTGTKAVDQLTHPATSTSDGSEFSSFQVGMISEKPVVEAQPVEKQVKTTTMVSPVYAKPVEKTKSTTTPKPNSEAELQNPISSSDSQKSAYLQTGFVQAAEHPLEVHSTTLSADIEETPVSFRADVSTKVDPSLKALKTQQTAVTDEKITSIETQREPKEMLQFSTAPAKASNETVVVGSNESRSAVEINPHTVKVVEQAVRQLNGRLKSGPTSMHLQLNPHELGAIDVKMVRESQGVSVTFFAEQASTGKLLETQLSQLRQSLMDSGVQLSGLNIGQHNHSGQEGGFLHQNTDLAGFSRREAPQSAASATENPRAERVNRQTSQVDYLI